jgi:hypothetical protein
VVAAANGVELDLPSQSAASDIWATGMYDQLLAINHIMQCLNLQDVSDEAVLLLRQL